MDLITKVKQNEQSRFSVFAHFEHIKEKANNKMAYNEATVT